MWEKDDNEDKKRGYESEKRIVKVREMGYKKGRNWGKGWFG